MEKCLENNSETLELLDLEFAPDIKSTPFLDMIRRLSGLHTLSLGSFRFTEFINAAVILSNLRLRSLTLRDCPYQLVLLQILAGLKEPIQYIISRSPWTRRMTLICFQKRPIALYPCF